MVDHGAQIRKLEVGIARDFLKIGRILRIVRNNGALYGTLDVEYDTFEEWVNENCGICYRKGQSLIAIVELQESLGKAGEEAKGVDITIGDCFVRTVRILAVNYRVAAVEVSAFIADAGEPPDTLS